MIRKMLLALAVVSAGVGAPSTASAMPTLSERPSVVRPMPPVYWGTYDGHDGCWALLGDTTYVLCADGYITST